MAYFSDNFYSQKAIFPPAKESGCSSEGGRIRFPSVSLGRAGARKEGLKT